MRKESIILAIFVVFMVTPLFAQQTEVQQHAEQIRKNTKDFVDNYLNGDAKNYSTYYNVRFGYAISFPTSLFIPQGESDNGDGQKFISPDKLASLLVWGGYNVFDHTIRQELAWQLSNEKPKAIVTYEVVKPDWFIISGLVQGKVFYQKTLLKEGAFKTFRLEYDPSQRAVYDSIIPNLLHSFMN